MRIIDEFMISSLIYVDTAYILKVLIGIKYWWLALVLLAIYWYDFIVDKEWKKQEWER